MGEDSENLLAKKSVLYHIPNCRHCVFIIKSLKTDTMKNFKWNMILAFAAIIFLGSCNQDTSSSPLLTGTIQTENLRDFQIAYSLDGDMMTINYQPIRPDSLGNFSFTTELPENTLDVSIYVNDDIFGVHLEKGKTTHIDITRNGRNWDATFSGDNADLSAVYSAYTKAYDIMKYFAMDPSESKSYEEYDQLADSEHAALATKINALKSKKWRNYYTQLSDGMYDWTKVRIIMDDQYETGKKLTDYPYYNEVVARINPNDDMAVKTNLLSVWYGAELDKVTDDDTSTDSYITGMGIIEKNITNPKCRKSFVNQIAHMYSLMGGEDGGTNKFWERFKEFAKDYPQIIEKYEKQVTSKIFITKGADVPYSPVLTRPDGTKINLSELKGKFTYIDIWATWCGPCVKEIPHLEKVAEHFKNNDKVQIISISTDSDKDAWLKKIENDKPIWPQYILDGLESSQFMQAWGISGIPRFIMLDKEGKVFEADAIRPSDESIIATIEAQL